VRKHGQNTRTPRTEASPERREEDSRAKLDGGGGGAISRCTATHARLEASVRGERPDRVSPAGGGRRSFSLIVRVNNESCDGIV
jgi:hypothetical protein